MSALGHGLVHMMEVAVYVRGQASLVKTVVMPEDIFLDE